MLVDKAPRRQVWEKIYKRESTPSAFSSSLFPEGILSTGNPELATPVFFGGKVYWRSFGHSIKLPTISYPSASLTNRLGDPNSFVFFKKTISKANANPLLVVHVVNLKWWMGLVKASFCKQ
jgi:hypothetical protein